MITIHITEKQFKHILKKLDNLSHYYVPSEDEEFVTWYNKLLTGLPFDIGILDAVIDDKNVFPVLFFKDEDNLIQYINVSYNPTLLKKCKLNKINTNILYNLIIKNVETLYLVSHGELSVDPITLLDLNTNTHLFLTEIPKVLKKQTGLPTDLWLDMGQTYKKGGHAPRLKFKDCNAGNKTSDFRPITIDDNPTVIDTGRKVNLKQPEIKKIKQYIIKNKDLLLQLIDNKIDFYNYFIPNMYVLSNDRFITHNRYIQGNEYTKTPISSFNITIVKSKDGLYNYYNEYNKQIISNYWFDTAIEFMEYGSEVKGRGLINGFWYDVDVNGTIRCVGRQ